MMLPHRKVPYLLIGSLTLMFLFVFLSMSPDSSLPTARAGALEYALDFDGVNDYVRLPFTADIMSPGWESSKTVTVWLKPDSEGIECPGQFGQFPQCDHIVQDFPEWWGISIGSAQIDNNGPIDRIWVWNARYNVPCPEPPAICSARIDVVPIPYTPGQWVHIALVHDGVTLFAYKNGVLVGSRTSGPTAQPSTGGLPKMYIGGFIGGSFDRTFDGQIDEVTFWNRPLSALEIQQLMGQRLTGNEPGLDAYYPMSDGSGLVLTDYTNLGCTDDTGCDGELIGPPDWVEEKERFTLSQLFLPFVTK